MPFEFVGVGPAGMGRYHGREGFVTLSNARSVLERGSFYGVKYLLPPFNTRLHKFLREKMIK